MPAAVGHGFVERLPKAELHAHLSGSISKQTLHEIWSQKRSKGACWDLQDPLQAIRSGDEFVDVITFFSIFDHYVYQLVDDAETVAKATKSVMVDFANDGVAYLELRTTPRENTLSGMTKAAYVATVHQAIQEHNTELQQRTGKDAKAGMEVRLILSVDRKMTTEQAEEVVDFAIRYQQFSAESPLPNVAGLCEPTSTPIVVVAVDICGNPAKGDVALFTPAFRRAKAHGLGLTVHLAEVPQSASDYELQTLLSWQPDRLGHAIHVADRWRSIIEDRRLGLELCLTCNVLAKLTTGGYAMHHFGNWRQSECPVALSTDDVGIFGSPLSNEYFLAAQHFNLDEHDLIALSKSAVTAAFSGRERMCRLLAAFEKQHASRSP